MNSMFISFGILIISIILATISNLYFDPAAPRELTLAEGMTDSALLVWLFPFFILVVIMLTVFVIKKSSQLESNKTIKSMTNFSALVLLLLQVVIISFNANIDYDLNVAIGVLVGIVTIVLANFMQKTKANLAYGLRLPWTLKDEDVWRKSNRFAAKILMLAGLLIVSLAFILPHALEAIVLAALGMTVLISVAYSYLISRQQTA